MPKTADTTSQNICSFAVRFAFTKIRKNDPTSTYLSQQHLQKTDDLLRIISRSNFPLKKFEALSDLVDKLNKILRENRRFDIIISENHML